jgi:hypothetical protein
METLTTPWIREYCLAHVLGEKSRGTLLLLLVADRGAGRIQSLMFSYDGE